jgi:hypothetical protein
MAKFSQDAQIFEIERLIITKRAALFEHEKTLNLLGRQTILFEPKFTHDKKNKSLNNSYFRLSKN